jgi:hypothetical protein
MYKLVDSAHAPEYRPVVDHHVARDLGIIAHYHIVANNTIMRQVTISHYQAILANFRLFLILCPAIYRHKFPDCRIVTNYYLGIFTLELKILWNGRDYCSRENPAILANAGPLHNGHIRAYPGAITYLNILVDNGKGVNFYICRKLGIGMYICVRMYHGVLQKSPPKAEPCKGNCYD